MGKLEVISFHDFMNPADMVLGISPPSLPLLEGLVGFSVLGVVLIGLSWADKMGWINVDESKIANTMFIGVVVGIFFLMFKARGLLGI